MGSPRCFYFGCWNRAGRYLHAPGGYSADRHPAGEFGANPFGGHWTPDGTLAPRLDGDRIVWTAQARTEREYHRLDHQTAECPQGHFLIHVLDNGFTAMAWWDRCQGDTRSGSNSVLLLEGQHDAAAMRAALVEHFQHVATNLELAGIELVEVSRE